MMVTRQEIMAYVDGEMDQVARNRITLAALADLDLAARIAQERGLRARLMAHFAPVAQIAPTPQRADKARWTTARPGARVVNLAAVRKRKAGLATASRPRRWNRSAVGGAIAAALVVGVVLGAQLPVGQPPEPTVAPATGPIAAHDGLLTASDDLAQALNTRLISVPDGTSFRILRTFRRVGGNLCRAFAGPSASGIACHDARGWQLQYVMPATASSAGPGRLAGSLQGELMTMAQGMTAGDPLDPAQERAAQANGWH